MSDRDLAITIIKWEQEGAKFGGPLKDLIEEIKQLFVEQARDLIEGQTICTEMDNFDAGYNTALNDIENAIRDKFK